MSWVSRAIVGVSGILFSVSLFALDTTFGGGQGWVTTAFHVKPESNSNGITLVQADGKLVVASNNNNANKSSSYANGGPGYIAVTRYNTDGSPDTAFGNNGFLVISESVANVSDVVTSVMQQADGKLVVAGYRTNTAGGGFGSQFLVVRLNADGTLDATFNSSGRLSFAISAKAVTNDRVAAVIQQTDGKLVVAGSSDTACGSCYASLDFAAVRLNGNGTFDTTFNGNGKVTKDIDGGTDTVVSVIQQSDGKLVLAGSSDDSSNSFSYISAIRLNTNGTQDSAFGTSGKIITDYGYGTNYAHAAIEQADGKLVVAGTVYNSSMSFAAVVRYNTNGTLDAGFGSNGILATTLGTSPDNGTQSVIQQSDGKLVATIVSHGSTTIDELVRYNVDGTLDTTFNGTGMTAVDFSTIESQQADGKLMVAGSNSSGFGLARYNVNGSVDTGFGNNGVIGFPYQTALASEDYVNAVIAQLDGKQVIAGCTRNGSNLAFAVARFNADGNIDTSFGSNGKVVFNVGSGDSCAKSVTEQADSKLVMAGYAAGVSTGQDFALLRINPDGTLDTGFGSGGQILTDLGATQIEGAASVIEQADGKLVAAGSTATVNGAFAPFFAVVRYNPNGSLDSSFGTGGKVITDGGLGNNTAYTVIQQSDDRLVVAGLTYTVGSSAHNDLALLRYNTDGSLDTAFNGSGKLTIDVGIIGIAVGSINAVIQQPDGKLAAIGYGTMSYGSTSNGTNFVVARINTNGSLDTGFNGTGIATTDFSGGQDVPRTIILQADGKLLVAGSTRQNSSTYFAEARYNTDGTLDSSFGSNGAWLLAAGPLPAGTLYNAFSLQPGKLVVAGYYDNGMPEGWGVIIGRLLSGQPLDSDGDGINDLNDCYPYDVSRSACSPGMFPTGNGYASAPAGSAAINGVLSSCAAGSYQPLSGQSSCITASAGYYVSGTGKTVETACPAGTYDPNMGSASSSDCQANTAQNCAAYSSIANACTSCTSGFIFSNGGQCVRHVPTDFSVDGTSDILFLNISTGGTLYWKDAVKAQAVYPGLYDTSYTYAGTGDFNGDGKADILFVKPSNNGTLYWSGAAKTSATYPGTGAAGFAVAAICDTDGDGNDDVVWYNASTGSTQIWPGAVKANATYPGKQNAGFDIVACADFDGDGKADIFWRNGTTGGHQIWPGAVKESVIYPGILPDTSWSVIGAGDVNGDGKADVIWYQAVNPLNPSIGSIGVWLSGQKANAVYPGSNGNTLTPVAIGDYDGDGLADLLWVNGATNGIEIWPGVRKGKDYESYPGTYPAGFGVQK